MDNWFYLKIAASLLVYLAIHQASNFDAVQAGMAGPHAVMAWSEGGRPFAKGEAATIDGQQMHDICFVEAWPQDGRYTHLNPGDTQTAADYVSCQGRMIEERPQRLCDRAAKTRYLRYLSGYFKWLTEDVARAKSPRGASVRDALDNSSSSGIAFSSATENPVADERIVAQLKSFVRLGLLSPKSELAPIMDVSLIAERSKTNAPAVENPKVCK
jgi:hypothetical protein